MGKAVEAVDNSQKKWFQRGFTDKHHYQGWLSFNDLISESHTFDDVYRDPYTGRVINVAGPEGDNTEEADEAEEFLSQLEKSKEQS